MGDGVGGPGGCGWQEKAYTTHSASAELVESIPVRCLHASHPASVAGEMVCEAASAKGIGFNKEYSLNNCSASCGAGCACQPSNLNTANVQVSNV